MNLRGVSTKLNKCIVFTMQTYKKLKFVNSWNKVTIVAATGKLFFNWCYNMSSFCPSKCCLCLHSQGYFRLATRNYNPRVINCAISNSSGRVINSTLQ